METGIALPILASMQIFGCNSLFWILPRKDKRSSAQAKEKRRAANAERRFFQPPLHLLRGVYSHLNLRVVAGKRYGRALENFKVTQTLCGSEIPPCSPRRAELVKNS
jgi:hypothetical protein